MMETLIRSVIKSHSGCWINFLELFCNDPFAVAEFLPISSDNLTCQINQPDEGVFTLYVTAKQLAHAINLFSEIDDFPFVLSELGLETLIISTGIRSWFQGATKVYGLNTALLNIFYVNRALGSASFGMRYLADTLHRSVAEISIQDANDDCFTGSGVVVQSSNFAPSGRVPTCKHNLYSKGGSLYKIQNIRIGTEEFKPVNILTCERIDICVVVLDRIGETRALPYGQPHVLTPIITAGFPKVRLLDSSPLLFHRGEINGFMGNIDHADREMIISTDVAPGSSGGPVISEFGTILGLVHERVETSHLEGKANYAKAIPSDQIVTEISDTALLSVLLRQDYIGRGTTN